jgi:cytochrome bd ubiquinol oxidase subunit I
MDLDAVLLSRIQFAFTIGFHIIFPTLTIGLASFLLLAEIQWRRTRDGEWKSLYRFWSKLFALAFGMGVVSGVVLSYQLGTNWGGFSVATSNVIGPLLGYEVLTAFFLEAGFLGIMLFGWNRVPDGVHLLATAMVALGTLLSAFWVLAANSWMHTPQGHTLVDGVFYVADFWAVIFNPSFPYRFAHMAVASYLTSAIVVAAVSALMILRGRREGAVRYGLSYGLVLAALLAPLQVLIGDLHGLNVKEHQPIKVAAMEALWETTRGAPLVLFAWPDKEAETNRYAIEIPTVTSLILTHDSNGEVVGLRAVPRSDRPNVPIVFFAFRLMVGLGVVMLSVAWLGSWLLWRGRLLEQRGFLRLLALSGPSGLVAVLAGWVVAESGRQPWVVHGLMRTADAVSPVAAGLVAFSLALFIVIYLALLAAFLLYAAKLVAHGPQPEGDASTPRLRVAARS